ncbi:MAG: MgtC/SapB family protein [Phycisphaeraceae bacterium]
MNQDQLTAVGLAMGLGLLVGLQREHAAKTVAGIRTFALITLLGAVCGLMMTTVGAWLVAVGLAGVAGMILMAEGREGRCASPAKQEDVHIGTTTGVAAMVMYGVGVMLAMNLVAMALIVAGVTAILLQMKKPLHEWVGKLDATDWRAISQFVLITLVILPVLPNQRYGPYQVLNPYRIWLMVVLIVTISLGAYVAYKLLGAKRGTVVGGLLGGLISSTATTVSFARMAREKGIEASGHMSAGWGRGKQVTRGASLGAVVIMLATAVVNVRVLVLMGVVSREMLMAAWGPVMVILGVMLLVCAAGYGLMKPGETTDNPLHGNPAQLKMAMLFASMYAMVLLAVAFAKEHLGNQGLYAVGAISGLTDLDAITLSLANMVSRGQVDPATAWRVVVVATMANLAFKAGIAGLIGGRAIFWRVALMFGMVGAVCAGLVVAWP